MTGPRRGGGGGGRAALLLLLCALLVRPSSSQGAQQLQQQHQQRVQPYQPPHHQHYQSHGPHSPPAAASSEYYDEDYYEDEALPGPAAIAQRQPKAAEHQEVGTSVGDGAVGGDNIYEDSYYYDDYEEPARRPAEQSDEEPRQVIEGRPLPILPQQPEVKQILDGAPRLDGIGDDERPERLGQESPLAARPASPENTLPPEDRSILIGGAIVSVVTTKSVVNGTYSVPESTTSPPATSTMTEEPSAETASEEPAAVYEGTPSTTPTTTTTTTPPPTTTTTTTTTTPPPTAPSTTTTTTTTTTPPATTTTPTTTPSSTTEQQQQQQQQQQRRHHQHPSTTIQPAVQTSRSVSGARFLPFPSVDKIEQLESTESIIDKLDRVQSELSSGFLANGRFVPRRYNKKPFSATSLTLPTTTTIAPTSSPIDPISITSISKRPRTQTTHDDIAALLPKDFPRSGPHRSTSASTSAPSGTTTTTTTSSSTNSGSSTRRPKIQTTLEDVAAFLPKDYPKSGLYRTGSPVGGGSSTKRPKYHTTLDDLEGFLPKDYPKGSYRSPLKRPAYKTSTTVSSSTSTTITSGSTERSTGSTGARKALTTIEDIGAFLPPGYKLKKEDGTTEKSVLLGEILAKSKTVDAEVDPESVATSTTERVKSIEDLFVKSAVDISALLPPGYKPEADGSGAAADSPSKSSTDDTERKADASSSSKSPVEELLAKSKVDITALLPPGFGYAASTPQPDDPPSRAAVGAPFKVVFPSRAGGRKPIHKVTTTPATGRAGPALETATPRIQKGWPSRATTEFTGWPTSSTTPISIEKLLEAARTATVSSADVSLAPTTSEAPSTTSSTTTTTTTTMRPTTPGICDEECEVAGTIRIVENATWVPELLDRNTREWQDLAEEIEREMNLVFAKSPVLRKWFRNIRIDSFSQGSVLVDYFVELADLKEKINTQQLKVIFHDSLRTFNFDNPMEARPKGPMKLGKFTIDPKSTDFVVIPRIAIPKMLEDENRLIPQWSIAVIVIGVGGLLFIIVFGVSVLVNRQQVSKLKPSITAMYEEEVSKNAMSHAAPPSRPSSEYQKNDSHTTWNDPGWHDKPFESTSHKILVDGFPYERKYNMYDSWKSEWNGYYYPPTQASGSNFSSHHPDYDMNF